MSKEMFLVCEDTEQLWFLIKAENEKDAVNQSLQRGYDPYYVIKLEKVFHVMSALGCCNDTFLLKKMKDI